MLMSLRLLMLFTAVLVPTTAHAGQCEDTFTKKGSPFSGIKYHAEVTVPNVTPQAALQQFRGAASAKGFDILADESANGQLLIAKPKTFAAPEEKSLVQAVAVGTGVTLSMDTKLASGTFSSGNEVKAEYCQLLATVQGGAAGIAAANRGRNSVSAAPPRRVDPVVLTQEIAEEGDANAEAVNARYQGKSFILSGFFDRASTVVGVTRIYFKTPNSTNDLVFHSGPFRRLPRISCALGPGQSVFLMSLEAGQRIKLQGVFDRYNRLNQSFALKDCVAAQ
jgi:hypothetical protein